jgi:hypothetical protein
MRTWYTRLGADRARPLDDVLAVELNAAAEKRPSGPLHLRNLVLHRVQVRIVGRHHDAEHWLDVYVNDEGWSVRIAGVLVGTSRVGFGTAYPMIGGELVGADATPLTSQTVAWYGESPGSPWQVYRASNRGNPATIGSCSPVGRLTPSQGWTVERCPPNPVKIFH